MDKNFKWLLLLALLFAGCGEQNSTLEKQVEKTVEENTTVVDEKPLLKEEVIKEEKTEILPAKKEVVPEMVEDNSIPPKSAEELADEEMDENEESDVDEEEDAEDKNIETEVISKSANELLDEERIEAEEE